MLTFCLIASFLALYTWALLRLAARADRRDEAERIAREEARRDRSRLDWPVQSERAQRTEAYLEMLDYADNWKPDATAEPRIVGTRHDDAPQIAAGLETLHVRCNGRAGR